MRYFFFCIRSINVLIWTKCWCQCRSGLTAIWIRMWTAKITNMELSWVLRWMRMNENVSYIFDHLQILRGSSIGKTKSVCTNFSFILKLIVVQCTLTMEQIPGMLRKIISEYLTFQEMNTIMLPRNWFLDRVHL